METYKNTMGEACVIWTDESGTHSMTQAHYEELEAAKEVTAKPKK
jgi:hypothetical protein